MKKWVIAAVTFLTLVFFDQFTKFQAVVHLRGNGYVPIISNVFGLEYIENTGAAFGMFKNMQWLFIISTLLVAAVILYIFRKMPFTGKYRPAAALCTILMSGAAGNLIDRVRQAYVVDFLYFKLINFPVFNVADCYVVISVILFLLLFLFYYNDDDLSIFWKQIMPPSLKKEEKENGEEE